MASEVRLLAGLPELDPVDLDREPGESVGGRPS